MNNLEEFFSRMNLINFPYVVLRNWEGLPHRVEMGRHSDLDLLVYDVDHWMEVFPDASRVYLAPRVQFKQKIGNSFIQVDVRNVGDGYYPVGFEKELLNTKVWNKNGFFTPNKKSHIVGLAYHAVHHKNDNDYTSHLGDATIPELLEVLQKTNIGWDQPSDISVGAYNSYMKGATSVVNKSNGKIIKKQVSFNDYSLIENEARILKKCISKHMPKLFSSDSDSLEIEDCGDHLTSNNIPEDWKNQLIEIIEDLEDAGIKHNDIKVDNLMVKDNTIMLIDFGWATFKKEETSGLPDCLGYPNRSPWGPDDNYAITSVARKIQYMIENTEGCK